MSIDVLTNVFQGAQSTRDAVEELVEMGFKQDTALPLAYMFQEIADEGGTPDGVCVRFEKQLSVFMSDKPELKQEIASLS